MAAIVVGTTSWTDKTLVDCGRSYPRDASSAEARLRHYASRFPLVEVDATYYALPAERTSQLWAERTPEPEKGPDPFSYLVTGTTRGAGGQLPRARARAPSKTSQLCAP